MDMLNLLKLLNILKVRWQNLSICNTKNYLKDHITTEIVRTLSTWTHASSLILNKIRITVKVYKGKGSLFGIILKNKRCFRMTKSQNLSLFLLHKVLTETSGPMTTHSVDKTHQRGTTITEDQKNQRDKRQYPLKWESWKKAWHRKNNHSH